MQIQCKTKENGQWRINTNEESRTKYKSQGIVTIGKIRRLQWLGHVSRMNERDQLSVK